MENYIFTGKDLEIEDLLKILEDDIKSGLYIFKDKNQSIQDYKNSVLQKRAEVTKWVNTIQDLTLLVYLHLLA